MKITLSLLILLALVIYSSSQVSQQLVSRYNPPTNGAEEVRDFCIDASGNVYATGNSSQGANSNDVFAEKYNSSGSQQWVNTLNIVGSESIYQISRDASSNIYLAGKTNAFGNGEDFLTLSYDPAGSFRWMMSYNYSKTMNDIAVKTIPDNSGNVYVIGTSFNDYATIKYSSVSGIQPVNTNSPSEFSLEQNYSNPFNPSTKLNFSIPVNGYISLKIFDINGREVTELVNEMLDAGYI